MSVMSPSEKELLIRIDERLSAHEKAVNTAHVKFDKTLGDILVQAKLTNGRVSVIELWKSKVRGIWLAMMIAGAAIGWIIDKLIEIL